MREIGRSPGLTYDSRHGRGLQEVMPTNYISYLAPHWRRAMRSPVRERRTYDNGRISKHQVSEGNLKLFDPESSDILGHRATEYLSRVCK
jgi:hypothetical protein